MSLSWEVPIHGSLVMRLSPGASVAGGQARRKCPTAVAREPMKDGRPCVGWAIICPASSKSAQVKSHASVTMRENAVLRSVAEASSTMAMSRLQCTASVTGSGARARFIAGRPRRAR